MNLGKRNFVGAILSAAMIMLPIQSAHTNDVHRYFLKIKALDKFQRSVIADTGVSIDAVIDETVYATGSLQEMKRVEKLGWLETSFQLRETLDFPKDDQKFHNYDELTKEIEDLKSEYEDILEVSSIGKSVEGRDIPVLRISGNLKEADKLPAVIFMGGHHAREHISVETPLLFAEYLLKEYKDGNEKIVNLLNGRDVHIIPAVNPDGLEFDVSGDRYHMWRKNRMQNADGTYGVDLNRNYGFKWGTGGSSDDGSSDVYKGPKPFSEPETQAIKNYVEAHVNITTLLSFHTFSELILYPWGHTHSRISKEQDRKVHETMARAMAKMNHYQPQQSSDLYIASGDTTDWSYGEHGIISFTFELDPRSGLGGSGFYPGQKLIDVVLKKNIEPALYLIEYADNPYRVIEE